MTRDEANSRILSSQEEHIMTYDEARESIVDGDIVFVAGGTSIWNKLTQLVTFSPYFHVGIAFWMRDSAYESRLFMVEAHNGGRRIVSLSSYADRPMTVVASEVPYRTYAKELLDKSGSVKYSIKDFIAIGLTETFKLKIRNASGEVCSEMVARALNNGNLYLPVLLSPGALYRRLVDDMRWVVKLSIN